MESINYNQKETKRGPGCFNYFSHIIWFCGGKPGCAKKRKIKSNSNYMSGKQPTQAFYARPIYFPQLKDKADDRLQNLAANRPWIQNLDAAVLDLVLRL